MFVFFYLWLNYAPLKTARAKDFIHGFYETQYSKGFQKNRLANKLYTIHGYPAQSPCSLWLTARKYNKNFFKKNFVAIKNRLYLLQL